MPLSPSAHPLPMLTQYSRILATSEHIDEHCVDHPQHCNRGRHREVGDVGCRRPHAFASGIRQPSVACRSPSVASIRLREVTQTRCPPRSVQRRFLRATTPRASANRRAIRCRVPKRLDQAAPPFSTGCSIRHIATPLGCNIVCTAPGPDQADDVMSLRPPRISQGLFVRAMKRTRGVRDVRRRTWQ